MANCVSMDRDGKPSIEVPKRTAPADDLARRMATLHAVGFFRALLGALDCLGASIVGVLAVPAPITFADLKTTRNILIKSQNPIHSDFRSKLDGILLAAGPAGWADWVSDFRNMVVHRGRRVHITQLVPRGIPLLGPDGKVIPRATIAEHLPSDPCRSQVEAFLDDDIPPILTEHAETTLRGALKSAIEVTRKTAIELSEVWALRRKGPTRLTQPKENWPALPGASSSGFKGYSPSSVPYKPKEWRAHVDLYTLFRTAALSDDLRPRWKDFD